MAKEGSVAPKERVNIVYKTDIGDAQEEVELPFRFLVVGDFTGKEQPDLPVEQRTLVSVDKTNFDDVLAGQQVATDLSVPNELTENNDGEELAVSLRFENMKDFSPDAITQQVPELAGLVGLRDALTMLKSPLGNSPAFRKQLERLLTDPEARDRILKELNLTMVDD